MRPEGICQRKYIHIYVCMYILTVYRCVVYSNKKSTRIQSAQLLLFILGTVELKLSGLIGAAFRPDMQKIRIIGFFFENRLHWQIEFGV